MHEYGRIVKENLNAYQYKFVNGSLESKEIFSVEVYMLFILFIPEFVSICSNVRVY